jgi:hypothetical protein
VLRPHQHLDDVLPSPFLDAEDEPRVQRQRRSIRGLHVDAAGQLHVAGRELGRALQLILDRRGLVAGDDELRAEHLGDVRRPAHGARVLAERLILAAVHLEEKPAVIVEAAQADVRRAQVAAVGLGRLAAAQIDDRMKAGRVALLDRRVEQPRQQLDGLLAADDHLLGDRRLLALELDEDVAALEQLIAVGRVDGAREAVVLAGAGPVVAVVVLDHEAHRLAVEARCLRAHAQLAAVVGRGRVPLEVAEGGRGRMRFGQRHGGHGRAAVGVLRLEGEVVEFPAHSGRDFTRFARSTLGPGHAWPPRPV